MRRISALADRLLDRVAPKTTAGASCQPSCYNWECAGAGFRHCCTDKFCVTTCGPCEA